VRLLQDEHPEASPVAIVGLERGSDGAIWEFVGAQQFIIATKDADFHDLSMQFGALPKILWLRIGP